MKPFCTAASPLLYVGLFLASAQGNWDNTSTGIDLDKLPRFPLTKVRSGWLPQGAHVAFDGITGAEIENATGREVRLRGVARTGKRWTVHLCCLDEVWRGDLDGNGTQDYVFFGVGPYGNGRTTPPFSISVLLMDEQTLPIPFFTTVSKGENGDGIKHLVDLNHDGHAELLISTYDEHTSDVHADLFCSGHWVTQLYRFIDFAAEEIKGEMGGWHFPFIHKWKEANGPNLTSLVSKLEPAELREHGTSRSNELRTIIRSVDSTGWMKINPVAGCTVIDPSVIVYDQPRVREIIFPNPYSSYPEQIATALMRHRTPIELRGSSCHGQCTVNLLWAPS